MLMGITKMSYSVIVVGALLAIGQIAQVVLTALNGPTDASLVDYNHAMLGIFVLLVGGKVAAQDRNGGAGK